MMRRFYTDCAYCRLMRSLAFTGIGMLLGGGASYLLGGSNEDMMLSGILVAAILVFGLIGKK